MRKGRFIRPFLHVKNYTENYDYLKFCHINSKKAGEGAEVMQKSWVIRTKEIRNITLDIL